MARAVWQWLVVGVVVSVAWAASADYDAKYEASAEAFLQKPLGAYALDGVARTVAATGKVKCPAVGLVTTRGTHVKYQKAVRVAEAFLPHLIEVEAAIVAAATTVYGRAPTRVTTLGTYNCRRMRLYSTYVSEHGLGNAIDIAAFHFAAAPKRERANVPASVRGAFTVKLEQHWSGGAGARALHQRFLQELVLELLRRDAARVLLGPNYPGHKNHFHLDMSPFRLVDV